MEEDFRQAFYRRLERDYREEGERSFLFRHFTRNPPKRRGSPGEMDPRRAVETFLYDATHGRKADKGLELFGAYCINAGIDPFFGGVSAPPPKEVDALYELLLKQRRTEVLIPVAIDSATGAGLYIIGRSYLGALASRIKGSCCYGVLYPNDMELIQEEDGCTWNLWDGRREDALENLELPSAEEGMCWLKQKAEEALDYFVVCNQACPPGCPAALRRYFPQAETPEWEDMVAYGRERFLQEEPGP